MYNAYLCKKGKALRPGWKNRFERTSSLQNNKNKGLTLQSHVRTAQWITENQKAKAAAIVQNGCSSLAHPDLHQFREFTPVGNVYLRR